MSNLVKAFETTLYYVGYRPTIGWIVTITLVLLFPIPLTISYINTIWNLGIVIDKELINALSEPIVYMALGIMGLRTIEKKIKIGEKYDDIKQMD